MPPQTLTRGLKDWPRRGVIPMQLNIYINAMLKKLVLGAFALVLALPGLPVLASNGSDDGFTSAACVALKAAATVTEAQAIATAQTKLAGTVTKARLKCKEGKAVWQIRIRSTDGLQRGDFRIDALTGEVLRERIKTRRQHHLSNVLEKFGLRKHEKEAGDDHQGRGRGRGSDDN